MKVTHLFTPLLKQLSLGIFTLLLKVALLCFQFGFRSLGRVILNFALRFIQFNINSQKLLYVAVITNAKCIDDHETKALLFADRPSCIGLGPLLRAAYHYAIGDLDGFIQSAEQAFIAAPDADMNKLVKMERAHYLCDPATVKTLLKSTNFTQNIPWAIAWKEEFFASQASDIEALQVILNKRLAAQKNTIRRPSRTNELSTARIAFECGAFDIADTYLGKDDIGTPNETSSIHLHHAANRHYGRNQDSEFFHPNHHHLLNTRNALLKHPALEPLKTKLIQARAMYDISKLPSLALFCPLHRIEDLDSILAQAQSQNTPNTTVYLIVNNCDHAIDEAEILARWRGPSRLKIYNFGVMPNLGSVIRQTLDLVTEDFFLKLDADCLYGPNYAADMVGQCLSRGADIIVKSAKFRFLSHIGLLDLQYLSSANRWYQQRDWAGGSAMAAPTAIWRTHALATKVKISEDVAFLRNAYFYGKKVYFADPFNHISVQQGDLSKHTFQRSSLATACLNNSYTVCRGDADIKKHVFL